MHQKQSQVKFIKWLYFKQKYISIGEKKEGEGVMSISIIACAAIIIPRFLNRVLGIAARCATRQLEQD